MLILIIEDPISATTTNIMMDRDIKIMFDSMYSPNMYITIINIMDKISIGEKALISSQMVNDITFFTYLETMIKSITE